MSFGSQIVCFRKLLVYCAQREKHKRANTSRLYVPLLLQYNQTDTY